MIRNDLISKDEITISIGKQFLLIILKENYIYGYHFGEKAVLGL